ncbi:MAG TPA: tRNA uridine(34) 5-carboxymethylaminomethyl modification radical SAM/GNAT enzyme Elp3 [Anaerolineae bacterium]|nr:tRNA uridine(34) 5-carboxymethylaminomethyl modification radical SAM/GNAT enzyme Elp3 [Anaerolineae bacterium]
MDIVNGRDITDVTPYADAVSTIIDEVRAQTQFDAAVLGAILRRHPRDGRSMFSKNLLVRTYKYLCEAGRLTFDEQTMQRLQMKPTRTISGVAPVTVLTKPYPCPGKCIFCPTDVRMPKSYLPDEPGAMRAEQHHFDPYAQTRSRIETFDGNGHATDKIELLILGGTWSSYRRDYQAWFVQRCLDAMNGRDSSSLAEAQAWNETAKQRNVGLVIETRPDHVDAEEIRWLRYLGVTKVQLGAQSLDDRILDLNQRGHTVEATRQAMTWLRAAGFKLVLHWMPNLLGATPESDRADFNRLWDDEGLRPDEIKIYPCSLLANAELYEYWQRGEYQPYSDEALIELIAACKTRVPRYCRINRVYRDIPAPNIVSGSKLSNMREVVRQTMQARGQQCECIRCREVRGQALHGQELRLDDRVYATRASEEHFLSFNSPDGKLAGYARLSLPSPQRNPVSRRPPNEVQGVRNRVSEIDLGIGEIRGAALIREVHVYGPALAIGDAADGRAQHRGLGTQLLAAAEQIAAERGYQRMAVIASIGTREYYAARGYTLEGTYMVKGLS